MVGVISAFTPTTPVGIPTLKLTTRSMSARRFVRQLPIGSVVKEGPKPVGLFSEVPTNHRECGGVRIPGGSTLWPVGLSDRS